jgi:hypothetical protein
VKVLETRRLLYGAGVGTKVNTSTVAPSGSTLGNGLVGYWSFNGTDVTDKVYDRSGQGNNGYFIGGATSTAKTIGKLGQALNFDGSDDYVGSGSIDLHAAVSISGWIISNTIDEAYHTILSNYNSGGTVNQYGLDFGPTGQLVFYVTSSIGNYKTWSTSNILSVNTWYYVTATHDGTLGDSGVKIYVNGVSQSLTPFTQGSPTIPTSSFGNTTIGRSGDYNGNYFAGKIDEIRLYNRDLSPTEAKQLYLQGR